MRQRDGSATAFAEFFSHEPARRPGRRPSDDDRADLGTDGHAAHTRPALTVQRLSLPVEVGDRLDDRQAACLRELLALLPGAFGGL
jgi:hypothetical protein